MSAILSLFGPFHALAHCTFCGTSDVYVFPGPREENEAYFRRLRRDVPAECCHFETHPTFCAECCGMQEDGHEYEYERGEGHRCKHCSAEPPHDWYGYDFD